MRNICQVGERTIKLFLLILETLDNVKLQATYENLAVSVKNTLKASGRRVIIETYAITLF